MLAGHNQRPSVQPQKRGVAGPRDVQAHNSTHFVGVCGHGSSHALLQRRRNFYGCPIMKKYKSLCLRFLCYQIIQFSHIQLVSYQLVSHQLFLHQLFFPLAIFTLAIFIPASFSSVSFTLVNFTSISINDSYTLCNAIHTSPVFCRPTTTHLPLAIAVFASSTTISTFIDILQ